MRKDTNKMLQATIQGIPCFIDVIEYQVVKGNTRADNDMDYYGYTNFEFDVYDRKGYRAKWLEAKMTKEDVRNIEELNYYNQQ